MRNIVNVSFPLKSFSFAELQYFCLNRRHKDVGKGDCHLCTHCMRFRVFGELKNNPEINVKKADKGTTTVIMNKLDKTQEGQTRLGSSKIRCGEKNMHASGDYRDHRSFIISFTESLTA